MYLELIRTLLLAVECIKAVSRQMLDEKLSEVDIKDSQSKRDIMSLLVRYAFSYAFSIRHFSSFSYSFRARLQDKSDGYKMSDKDLIEQVVRRIFPT